MHWNMRFWAVDVCVCVPSRSLKTVRTSGEEKNLKFCQVENNVFYFG